MDDVVDLVRRSLSDETRAEFSARVDEQAAALREAIAAGRFDNEDFAVGLEVEVYAINEEPEPIEDEGEDDDANEERTDEAEVDADLSAGASSVLDPSLEPDEADADGSPEITGEADAVTEQGADDEDAADEPDEPYMDPDEWEGKLASLPESVFDGPAAKELGVHNAEINTDPDVFGATGLEVQTTSVEMQFKKARDAALDEHRDLVLDAMWTIPPEEGTVSYFSEVEERDGVVIAENMRQYPRYVALDNEALGHAGGEISFSVPGAEHEFPTILFESLTTSIQPHLQIPSAAEFPDYYNAAIRTLGPILALTANSPFLPRLWSNSQCSSCTPLRGSSVNHSRRNGAKESSATTRSTTSSVVSMSAGTRTLGFSLVLTDCSKAAIRSSWWVSSSNSYGSSTRLYRSAGRNGEFAVRARIGPSVRMAAL